jgi:hypothetical protein
VDPCQFLFGIIKIKFPSAPALLQSNVRSWTRPYFEFKHFLLINHAVVITNPHLSMAAATNLETTRPLKKTHARPFWLPSVAHLKPKFAHEFMELIVCSDPTSGKQSAKDRIIKAQQLKKQSGIPQQESFGLGEDTWKQMGSLITGRYLSLLKSPPSAEDVKMGITDPSLYAQVYNYVTAIAGRLFAFTSEPHLLDIIHVLKYLTSQSYLSDIHRYSILFPFSSERWPCGRALKARYSEWTEMGNNVRNQLENMLHHKVMRSSLGGDWVLYFFLNRYFTGIGQANCNWARICGVNNGEEWLYSVPAFLKFARRPSRDMLAEIRTWNQVKLKGVNVVRHLLTVQDYAEIGLFTDGTEDSSDLISKEEQSKFKLRLLTASPTHEWYKAMGPEFDNLNEQYWTARGDSCIKAARNVNDIFAFEIDIPCTLFSSRGQCKEAKSSVEQFIGDECDVDDKARDIISLEEQFRKERVNRYEVPDGCRIKLKLDDAFQHYVRHCKSSHASHASHDDRATLTSLTKVQFSWCLYALGYPKLQSNGLKIVGLSMKDRSQSKDSEDSQSRKRKQREKSMDEPNELSGEEQEADRSEETMSSEEDDDDQPKEPAAKKARNTHESGDVASGDAEGSEDSDVANAEGSEDCKD